MMTGEQTENDMAKGNVQVSSMMTVREVSQLLHVHGNTVRRWTDKGMIRAYRIGPRGDRRFRAEDIAALLLKDTKGIRIETAKKD